MSIPLDEEAGTIESAVGRVLEDGLRTNDIAREGEAAMGTAEMGAAVAVAIAEAEVAADA